jgi:hypothetical protein
MPPTRNPVVTSHYRVFVFCDRTALRSLRKVGGRASENVVTIPRHTLG